LFVLIQRAPHNLAQVMRIVFHFAEREAVFSAFHSLAVESK
jgi:hypothetical protein